MKQTWQRLEPIPRDPSLEIGIQVQVHDPMWLLARQWQWGEFIAEDIGSPISVRLLLESNLISRGPMHQPCDLRTTPLEAIVERETKIQTEGAEFTGTTKQSAQAGAYLVHLLRNVGVGLEAIERLNALHPLQETDASEEDARYLKIMAGRVPNGFQVARLLGENQDAVAALIDDLSIKQTLVTAVSRIFQDWTAWYASLPPEPQRTERPTGWLPERMEYNFTIAAPSAVQALGGLDPDGDTRDPEPLQGLLQEISTERLNPDDFSLISEGEMSLSSRWTNQRSGRATVLSASGYRGGRLDWHAFDIVPKPNTDDSLQTVDDERAPWHLETLLPTAVRFPGMPLDRWWAFEDASVNFGMLDTAPEDLSRLVFNEFITNYSNDWFVLPVELGAGSVTRLHWCRVMNTFGEVTVVAPLNRPSKQPAWQMFTLSGSDEPLVPFFLAPTLPPHQQGDAVEEIRLIRDEAANLAWAIERITPSPVTGAAVNRFERYQAQRQTEQSPKRPLAKAPITYRLGTDVPDHWIPLVPRHLDESRRAILLERGALLNTEAGHIGEVEGTLLFETDTIHDVEVPRSGVRVTRHYQLTRWSDGSTHLWLAREKSSGRGEGSSGLLYDVVEPSED